jgi:hypothetical protein
MELRAEGNEESGVAKYILIIERTDPVDDGAAKKLQERLRAELDTLDLSVITVSKGEAVQLLRMDQP